MISEVCGCGASISLDRSDEKRLWVKWKRNHSCPPAQPIVTGGESHIELVSTISTADYPLGFQWIDDEPEDRRV
jgi:hypothetical protein